MGRAGLHCQKSCYWMKVGSFRCNLPSASIAWVVFFLLWVLLSVQSDACAGMVHDAAGRRIVVKKPFERIISLYGAHTENLLSLGLIRKIIGVSRNDINLQGAKQKPWYSYHDDPEKFLGSRPDLILVRPMIERGYPDLIDRLERSGIAVASLQPSTVGEMYNYWLALGILTGKENRAQEMVNRFKNRVRYYSSLTADIKIKKRVYFEAMHSRMKTFAPGSMALFVLETAGGINVAADARPSRGSNIGIYGKERILSNGPWIDVFLAQQGVMNPVTVDDIKNEPGFNIIKAVKTNQIYTIDEMIVSRPVLRLLTGIRTMGEILYPNLFTIIPEERI